MKLTLLGGMTALAVLAGIPPTAAAQGSQSAPPGLVEPRDTLPPGLEKRDALPSGLQGRGLEDYGRDGQTAADRDVMPGEPQQAATGDSLKKSSEDAAATEHGQDQKLDKLPQAK